MTTTTRVFGGAAALAVFHRLWPALYAADPDATPYQAPAWISGWAMQPDELDRPLALLAYDRRERPVAGLALGLYPAPGSPEIRPLGNPASEITRLIGPAAEDAATVQQVGLALEGLTCGRSLSLPSVPEDSALARHLAGRSGWHTPSRYGYASVPLPLGPGAMPRSTWRAHEQCQEVWEDLARDTDVHYTRTRSTPALVSAWDVLTALHQRRRAGGADPRLRGLLASVGAVGATIATLAVRTRYVAAHLVLTRGRRAWSLATGTEDSEPWKGLDPGRALLQHLAVDLAACGYDQLDLGKTTPLTAEYDPARSGLVTYNRADQGRRSLPSSGDASAPRVAGTVA